MLHTEQMRLPTGSGETKRKSTFGVSKATAAPQLGHGNRITALSPSGVSLLATAEERTRTSTP